MEEKKLKKKKLTLTVSSKKTFNIPHYTRSSHKKSVVIEKKSPRRWGEKKFQSRDNNINKPKLSTDYSERKTQINRNIDIRRMAEERATKRFKNPKEDVLQKRLVLEKKKALLQKEKLNSLCQKLWMMKL